MQAKRIIKSPFAAVAVAGLAISIIVITRAGSLRTEHYLVKQTPVAAQVAWSRNAAGQKGSGKILISIHYAAVGRHESRLRGLVSRIGETLGVFVEVPEPLVPTTELIALEVKDDGSSTRLAGLPSMKDSSIFTQFVSHDGNLYLLDRRSDVTNEDEDYDPAPVLSGSPKSWRLDRDKFVEISEREARSVSESVRRMRRRGAAENENSTPQNQSANWQVCSENVYSFNAAVRCSISFGSTTWSLRFNRNITSPLAGPISAQLVNDDDREQILIADNSNLWVETDALSYSARQNNLLPEWRARFGSHFTGSWTSYLFGLLVALGIPYVFIRSSLNRSTNSKPYFPEVKPEDFPGLDRQRLEEYTHFLLANGFTHLRDYTAASSSPSRNRPPSFARVFVNNDLKCFAEVAQIFTTQQRAGGLHCSFINQFNDQWRYSTTSRISNPVTYIARRPRTLWLSRPGMPISDMLSLHIQMINQMRMQLGVSPTEDVSIEDYFRRSAQSVEELQKIIRRKSVWVFPLMLQYQYQKERRNYEWLGDYGLKAPAGPWTPPTDLTGNNSAPAWQRILTRWAPTISVASTVMLGFSAYLFFFHESHSLNTSMFRLTISVLGLSGYGLLALAKKKS